MSAQREAYITKLKYMLGDNINSNSAEQKVQQLYLFLIGEDNINLTQVRNGMEMLLTAANDIKKKYETLSKKVDVRNEKKSLGDLENKKMKLNREIEQRQSQIRELETKSNRLSKDISEKKFEVGELKNDIEELTSDADALKEEIKNLRNITKAESKRVPVEDVKNSSAPSKEVLSKIQMLNNRVNKLTEEKEKLSEDNLRLKEEVKKYHSADRFFLDTIQRTYQARYNKGKAITLRQDEIEKVFRTYVHLQTTLKREPTRYRIAKEADVGHKVVDYLLNYKYTNINSLRKIVAALHEVHKGGWGEKNEELLSRIITNYETLLAKAEQDDAEQRAAIKNRMGSLPEAHDRYLEKLSSK